MIAARILIGGMLFYEIEYAREITYTLRIGSACGLQWQDGCSGGRRNGSGQTQPAG